MFYDCLDALAGMIGYQTEQIDPRIEIQRDQITPGGYAADQSQPHSSG